MNARANTVGPRSRSRRAIIAVAVWLAVGVGAERAHIVIPAGPGGGLDGTARESGRALVELGLVEHISYENVSGGGGGRAMA